jgi:hypothetical protein
MPSIRQILPVLAAAVSVEAAMGPAFSTGPVGSGSWIRESTSTLVLPKAPSGSSGDASLWVGMGTSNGDLIQSIADNWNSDSWSIYGYTLLSISANQQMPVQTESTNAVAGDKITMHCKSPHIQPHLQFPPNICRRQVRRRNRQLHTIRLYQQQAGRKPLHK